MHHQAAALCGNDILISDATPANWEDVVDPRYHGIQVKLWVVLFYPRIDVHKTPAMPYKETSRVTAMQGADSTNVYPIWGDGWYPLSQERGFPDIILVQGIPNTYT
jgi:hypothetical protein